SGHEDDRSVGPLAKAPADVAAGAVGQEQVEDDGVGRTKRRGGERVGGRGRGLDLVAGPPEVRRERTQELRLVVDDEDTRRHTRSSAGSGRAGTTTRAQVPPP